MLKIFYVSQIGKTQKHEEKISILKEKNKAAILVTHSIDEALAIADSVYVLNHHNLVRLSDKIEEEFKSLRQVNQSKSYSIIKAKVWDLMM